jgi:hypothetical protein
MRFTGRKIAPATLPELAGVTTKVKEFGPRETIYSQGDAGKTVIYIQKGAVKLSAKTQAGKEAVVAVLGAGDFNRRKVPEWLVGPALDSYSDRTLHACRHSEERDASRAPNKTSVLRCFYPLSARPESST